MNPWIESTELDGLNVRYEIREFSCDLIASLFRALFHLEFTDVGCERSDAVARVFIVHRAPNVIGFIVEIINIIVVLIVTILEIFV